MDPLKPLSEVLLPDERWSYFSRDLADHHALISSIELNPSVPEKVCQHFENARNTWLYAFFAYRLLSVASLAVHVACEAAVKARAEQDGLPASKTGNLLNLLDEAVSRGWLTDEGFSASADREAHWIDHREIGLALGHSDIGPWQEPEDPQEHTRRVVTAIRMLRNSMAHGDTHLVPNLSPTFQAAADFINQLFPTK
jgi:hypothetical protein